ncbi:hypothetical protein NLC35_03615 [Candidatus Aminicenantes bacterium AC-334-K16]|nr:hypothetical protein [Candidatus Aminicenantes bacterium AC-334-K16]
MIGQELVFLFPCLEKNTPALFIQVASLSQSSFGHYSALAWIFTPYCGGCVSDELLGKMISFFLLRLIVNLKPWYPYKNNDVS